MNTFDLHIQEKIAQKSYNDDWLNFVFGSCSPSIQKEIIKIFVEEEKLMENADVVDILLSLTPLDFGVQNDIIKELKLYSAILSNLAKFDYHLYDYPHTNAILARLNAFTESDFEDIFNSGRPNFSLSGFSNLMHKVLTNHNVSEMIHVFTQKAIAYGIQNNINWYHFNSKLKLILSDDINEIPKLCYHRYLLGQEVANAWIEDVSFLHEFVQYESAMVAENSISTYIKKEVYIKNNRYKHDFIYPHFTWLELIEAKRNEEIFDVDIYNNALYSLLTDKASVEIQVFVAWSIHDIYTETNIKYMQRWRAFNIPELNSWLDRLENKILTASENFDNYNDIYQIREFFKEISNIILNHYHKKYPILDVLYASEPHKHPFNFGYLIENTMWNCHSGTWETTSLDGPISTLDEINQQWSILMENDIVIPTEESLML